jgi:hypothetical protein
MFKKIKEILSAPFVKSKDFVDRHPSGSSVKQYAEALRLVDYQGKLTLIVPAVYKSYGIISAEDLESLRERQVFCQGYNAALINMSKLRRSDILPALKLHNEALKAKRKSEKEMGKQLEPAKDMIPSTGTPRIPPQEVTGSGSAIEVMPAGAPA